MGQIDIIKSPFNYNPVSAPIWVQSYTSSAVSLNNFNYKYSLYDFDYNTGATNSLGVYNIPARPDGYGYWDIHKIIKTSLDTDLVNSVDILDNFGILNVDNQGTTRFFYRYGYSNDITIPFTSTGKVASVGGDMVSLIGVTGSTSLFSIGDVITVDMAVWSSNGSYNGQSLITGFSGTNIITNIEYGLTESSIGGVISNIQRFVGTSSTYYGVNGTRQYYNPLVNNSIYGTSSGYTDLYYYNNFVFGNGSSAAQNFLTNYDRNTYKEIFGSSPCGSYDQGELAYFISPTQSNLTMKIDTYDSSFILIGTYSNVVSSITSLNNIYCVPVGTANIASLVDLTNVMYYTISIYDDTLHNFISLKRKIVKNDSVYDNVRVCFLNRVGGYDFFNFNYDSKYSIDIKRKEYTKTLSPNYMVGDRGRSIMSMDVKEQFIINTDWISEYDYGFLEELITSPEVFILKEETGSGVGGRTTTTYINKIPIIITDNSYEKKTLFRDQLFNMKLTFEYAFSKNIQSN